MKPLYIDGAWVDGANACPNINPSDLSDVIDDYAWADAAQVAQAVTAARRAFPVWSRTGIQQRADALDVIGSEILARKTELGDLLAREEGKTLPEAIGEVTRAGHIFKFYGGEALRIGGAMQASVRPGIEVATFREPIGVVGLIAPWNFPIAIPAWKIAPALACGNCVVFKPAERVPGSAWALAEIISRAGLPPGVFNMVMGEGAVVGRAIVDAPGIDGISFTGSIGTGNAVMTAAAQRMAKVQLEMGGKNPLIVLDDADIDTAVHCALQGAYYSTGQRCTASSRLIVTRGVHDRFVDALVRALSRLTVDDARKPGTHIGPVIDQAQLDKDLRYIELGQAEGARLLCGGELLARATRGHYLGPALFVDATNTMRIAREEIFGPVACVIRADDYEHALDLANDTEFGLSAGICTTSLKHAMHFRQNAQAGVVMVNLATAGIDYHVPFGGSKASSHGPREQGHVAIEFFTRSKTAYSAA